MDSKAIAAKLKKVAQAEIGIYYVIRYPRRWRLFPLQEGSFGDMNHISAWRSILAPEVASAWSSVIGIDAKALTQQLLSLPHAFPRGRIEKVAVNEFSIYHGDDLAATGIPPTQILQAFTLTNKQINWVVDPHEQCELSQKDAIRRILNITDDWPAV